MFSIIIPVRNEGFFLDMTLDSIYNYVDINLIDDIIIVDDKSQDQDFNYFKSKHFLKDKIKIIQNNESLGPSQARNIGVDNAKGKYLIFLDAHVYCFGLNLHDILKLFDYDSNGIFTGKVYAIDNKLNCGYLSKIKSNLIYTRSGKNKLELEETPLVGAAFMILKKDLFYKLGGFNRFYKAYGFEDTEFSIRAWSFGYKCYFYENIYIAHYFRQKFPYSIIYQENVYNAVFIFMTYILNIYKKDYLIKQSMIKTYGEEYFLKAVERIKNDPLALSYISWIRSNIKIDLNDFFDKNIIWD